MTAEPIAKCRCGRRFTPMEWAELGAVDTVRRCPCGLAAARIITLTDIERAYQESLEDLKNPKEEDDDD